MIFSGFQLTFKLKVLMGFGNASAKSRKLRCQSIGPLDSSFEYQMSLSAAVNRKLKKRIQSDFKVIPKRKSKVRQSISTIFIDYQVDLFISIHLDAKDRRMVIS